MRARDEFADCCCPDDIASVAQVVVDQLIGMVVLASTGAFAWDVKYVLRVCELTGGFMQEHLDNFVQQHGQPSVGHQVAATEAILKAMAG